MKKEKSKKHYVEVIREKGPVRPSELGFKRVRYDYLDQLVYSGEIGRKKFGRGYTLLFMLEHEVQAEERHNREAGKNYFQKKNIKIRTELKFDFSVLIDNWVKNLPSFHINIVTGANRFDGKKMINLDFFDAKFIWYNFNNAMLFSEFKNYIENLHEIYPDSIVDPIKEQEFFIDKLDLFLEKRMNLIKKICNIIIEQIEKIEDIIETEDWGGRQISFITIPHVLLLDMLFLLDPGSEWEDEYFINKWFKHIEKFDSYIYDTADLYRFYKEQLRFTDFEIHFKGDHLFHTPKRKKFQKLDFINLGRSKTSFSDYCLHDEKGIWKKIDNSKEKILRIIDQSTEIKKSVIKLKKLESELNSDLNKIKRGLYKIKMIK